MTTLVLLSSESSPVYHKYVNVYMVLDEETYTEKSLGNWFVNVTPVSGQYVVVDGYVHSVQAVFPHSSENQIDRIQVGRVEAFGNIGEI